MPVALEAPFHKKCVFPPGHGNLINRAVACRTLNAAMHMNAVIEIDKIRKVVDASPFERPIFTKTGAHRFERRAVRPDLRMTVHANLRGRNSSKRTVLHGGMAVTAIDSDAGYVVLVTERNR